MQGLGVIKSRLECLVGYGKIIWSLKISIILNLKEVTKKKKLLWVWMEGMLEEE